MSATNFDIKAWFSLLPASKQWRGKTIVLKYGGSAMEDEAILHDVWKNIALLHMLGVRLAIVHGGGKVITRRMEREGLEAKFIGGLRVTDAKAIACVEKVLHEEINPQLVNGLTQEGADAEGISGKTVFQAIPTKPVIEEGKEIDLGFVGDVTACHLDEVKSCLAREKIPVISPLGADANGQAYNINADIAAGKMAVALQADCVVYLSDICGLLKNTKDASTRLPIVNLKLFEVLKKEGIIHGGMVPKVNSFIHMLQSGVSEIYLLDGRQSHSLSLALLAKEDIGTYIHP